jgi:uncharacterized DUF497 family protein
MEMRFVWDPAKAESNLRKHGISFEEAAHVFGDELRQTRHDRLEGGEYRWQTLGVVQGVTVLLVAHTITEAEPVEEIRIISARRATRRERKQYEENR